MLPAAELAALTRRMLDAQDSARQIEPLSSGNEDFDLPAAYAVAGLIHRERVRQRCKPVGRKIGFSNPEMWAIYGVSEPIWAHVYDSTLFRVEDGCATCSLGRFAEPKIEPEIVLHFRDAPPANGSPGDILASIDWIALAFELVQSHFPGWRFRAQDTVADAGLHGALFLGAPRPLDRLGSDLVERLGAFTLSLFEGGRLRETGSGANVLGSPLLAIAHLVAVLRKQPDGLPLQPGELVTTGTVTTAHDVWPGEHWSAEVEGLDVPGLSIRFVP